ncbi:HEAT repeat domain-containing protein [Limnoglobus roseus]|uniref:HEAT repeat domain-containing protein n=1 Tax=Limnoglobus roseus TaxID=2598579 RepID=A0A5C1AMH3_9BACT|nr:HEAT repeat domain-containing protein [Limnoglobus roseus]QEL18098.1 HEAT repeat domain-containing protein [Limnoglobus roseus]
MPRRVLNFVLFAVGLSLSGCTGAWDKMSSRKFRDHPYDVMFDRRDPLTVMRTSPEGDDRAGAMKKLKEPAANGRSADEQEEALKLLTDAAINDPSPVVRVAAIDALGRFQDVRAVKSLTAAYYQSGGTSAPKTDAPLTGLQLTSGGRELGSMDRSASLSGPSGFAPDVASVIRSRAVEALANTGKPEAVGLLTQVAAGTEKTGGGDRDTRLAAVRGLKQLRTPESVAALSGVLTAEKTRDPALADRAHEGLVNLTGQSLPNDPQKWDAVVKSGQAAVVPAPNAVQQAGAWIFGN